MLRRMVAATDEEGSSIFVDNSTGTEPAVIATVVVGTSYDDLAG